QRRARSRAARTFSRQVRLRAGGGRAAQDVVVLLRQTPPALEVTRLGRGLARGLGADTGLEVGWADPSGQPPRVGAEVLRDLRDGDAVLRRTGRTTTSRNSWDPERA